MFYMCNEILHVLQKGFSLDEQSADLNYEKDLAWMGVPLDD
ncbi:hypothetical protein F383_31949 [Gossypium arboreum]|uniref:Uncharacterized protein n=1 Tax=Gossypium arboreum TaxID=29729 RepID=A0A0B0PGJ5_GOSAR|nr:hypothetical protein F383_31949 [Gossypium arboreum]